MVYSDLISFGENLCTFPITLGSYLMINLSHSVEDSLSLFPKYQRLSNSIYVIHFHLPHNINRDTWPLFGIMFQSCVPEGQVH